MIDKTNTPTDNDEAKEVEEDYGFLDDDPGYEFSLEREYVDYADSEDDLVDYD